MEFRDLKTQYIKNKDAIDSRIAQTLQAGVFIGGETVKALEEKLAKYVGRKHCISCANGTDALQLALMAWGIKEGDAVFVPDFTFFSSGEVVMTQGATPVFVDVIPETFNISPEKLEESIQKVLKDGKLVPRVVVAVDLFGQTANFEKIEKIADRYGLLVLEDGAQGFGGEINGKRACSFGNISTTSFFPAKPLGCYGDGGAVFTDDDDIARIIQSYKVHGKGEGKYDNVRIGMNSRLDTIQAAILIEKLAIFEEYELEQINKVAKYYDELLQNSVEIPCVETGYKSSWAQYSIKLKSEEERDRVKSELQKQGIPSMIYYPKPMHLQKAFANIEYMEGDCPVTEDICKRILALPIHPYLTKEEVNEVCTNIHKIIGR